MSDDWSAIIVIAFGFLLMNFAACGMVAILFFWKGMRQTVTRALLGAALTSGIVMLLFSGVIIVDAAWGGESSLVIGVSSVVLFIVSAALSLPGAFLMSQKITKSDGVGDIFD